MQVYVKRTEIYARNHRMYDQGLFRMNEVVKWLNISYISKR